MSHLKRPDYDDLHGFVERVEDVLLSESSWSTSDSDCSGCLHLSKESLKSEEVFVENRLTEAAKEEVVSERTPLVVPSGIRSIRTFRRCSAQQGAGNTTPAAPVPHPRSPCGAYTRCSPVSPLSQLGVPCSDNFPAWRTGRMLRQHCLLAAGAQPWHRNVCGAEGSRFAYAATLVIYVYEADDSFNDWQLCSVLADHRKTITSVAWHPQLSDLLASSSEDQRVCVWSVSQQRVLHAVSLCRTPALVAWHALAANRVVVSFSTATGPVQVWEATGGSEPCPYRESHPYSGGVRLFRWHPSVPGRLAVAHAAAKITLYRDSGGQVKSNWCLEAGGESGYGQVATGEVLGMEWAPCSPDYLLLHYSCGRLWLADTSAQVVVTVFSLPAAAVTASIDWLPHAPGLFVTGDRERGVLRVWSAGSSTALHTYSLKDTGFHELCAARCPAPEVRKEGDGGGSSGKAEVPAVPVLCLFKDGGVGLYHIRRKQWIFNREHGHTETIFDCSFKPDDSDLLATGSFDGSIKIWRVDALDAVATLPPRSTIVYSVSWAPADLNCVAAGTSGGHVFVWDVTRSRIINEFQGHKKNKVYCVTWNQKDSRRIASVGDSCLCLVHEVSGAQLCCYKHPAPVFGCDWRGSDTLATGCGDGKIRVYTVTSSHSDADVVLKAHNKKVFRVKWNPTFADILCSGSDDCTVRLWSVSREQCLAVLAGHTDNVRGLVWCPELPYLLVSGAWDRSIRVWDARNALCLDVVREHGADIYGLSIHPVRPFLLASCSRDSTVRLWSLTTIVAALQLRLLARRPLEQVLTTAEDCAAGGLRKARDQLCGLRAQHLLAAQQKSAQRGLLNKTMRLAADVFSADVHARNLWDLMSVVTGQTSLSCLSPHYQRGIVHRTHLAKCGLAGAEQQLQRSGAGQNARQDTALAAVADRYLKAGALRQYCEVSVLRRRWDHALALAPAVSLDYWRQLLRRYGQQLAVEDSDLCLPYLQAGRDLDALLQFHIARGEVQAAFNASVAVQRPAGVSRAPPPQLPPRPSVTKEDGGRPAASRQEECAKLLADWHLARGTPVLASCAALAADYYTGCLHYLLRGHELELVVWCGRLMLSSRLPPSPDDADAAAAADPAADPAPALRRLRDVGVRYLCYRAVRLGLHDVALELARTAEPGLDTDVLSCEVFLLTPPHQRATLHGRALPWLLAGGDALLSPDSLGGLSPQKDEECLGSPSSGPANTVPGNCSTDAATADRPHQTADVTNGTALTDGEHPGIDQCPPSEPDARVSDKLSDLMKELLSAHPLQGMEATLQYVVGELPNNALQNPDMWRAVRLLQACPLVPAPKESQPDPVDRHEKPAESQPMTKDNVWPAPPDLLGAVLAVSAATGAVKAAVLGYTPVVTHLIWLARMYIGRYKPRHSDILENFTKGLEARCEQHKGGRGVSAEVLALWPDSGETRVTGCHLPRHADARTCCISRSVVKGPSFPLEEGEAMLGLNEAIMLAKVHPYSPLGSCRRLWPF